MNRHGLAAAAFLVASSAAAAAPSGWVTVGEGAYIQLKQSGLRVTIRANRPVAADEAGSAENLYVLQVPKNELDRLAGTLHRALRHCGGFMYHASEAEALRALEAPRVAARPSYELGSAALVRPLLPQLDEHRIAQTITQLAGFVNRYYTSPHGAEAANWLRAAWAGLSEQHKGISVAQFQHAGYGQRSVIATIAGTDRAAETIVLGAHLDSVNLGLRPKAATAPGADDDASGIAALTEVLRVLAANQYQPRRTIKLIGYAAEEVGLRGSQDIARDFKRRQVAVLGVLQLDMVNYQGSAKDIYLISDYTDGEQNRFLEKLVAAYLPALTVGIEQCGYACSDHAAWHAQGYPASMPFEAMMKQDNPHIHTRDDTFANSRSQAAHALKFARLAAAYAVELGSTP